MKSFLTICLSLILLNNSSCISRKNTDISNEILPASAAQCILNSQPQFENIADVSEVVIIPRKDFDVMAVRVTIEKSIGFESVYHTCLLLRKEKTDNNWLKSHIYYLHEDSNIDYFLKRDWQDMLKKMTKMEELTPEQKARIKQNIRRGKIQ